MNHFRKMTEEELKARHLSFLRELGRQIGVKSPTSKSKDVLISQIMAIQDGRSKPVAPSGRGAKPKLHLKIADYLESEDQPANKADEAAETEDDSRFGEYKDQPAAQKAALGDVNAEKSAADNNNKDYGSEYVAEGVLEILSSGYGFLRASVKGNSPMDIYVSLQKIRQFGLRKGDKVRCTAKAARSTDSDALQNVITINGFDPAVYQTVKQFDELVPYYPTRRLRLERDDREDDLAIRCVDLFSPIGFGQRGMIVAPPKTGKTTLMKKIAQSVEKNYPEAVLIVLLIDERPEEVTDFMRSVNCEVLYSTFDESADHHVRVAESVLNRARRIVEVGKDVVVLLDSITKLTRAYNATVEGSGRTLSGGLDPEALAAPKKFFGAARNIENGGSLTIISTALVDTGSRMDDVIYEEFKGTGNMEIHLSRSLSEKRVFPAIDLYKSGTRKDELLLDEREYDIVMKLRRMLAERQDASESLLEMLKKTKDNAAFVTKADAWIKLYNKE